MVRAKKFAWLPGLAAIPILILLHAADAERPAPKIQTARSHRQVAVRPSPPVRLVSARARRAAPLPSARPKQKPKAKKPAPAVKRPVSRGPAVSYRKLVGAGVPMHVVRVDVRRPDVHVTVATSGGGIGTRDGWSEIVDRTHPVAALTGTYFCTESALPIGSIVVDGRQVYDGTVGTLLSLAPGQGARMLTCKPNRSYSAAGAETALRAGPRLLSGGRRTLFPEAEGFHDPAIFKKKKRTAVALTKDGYLLLVAVEKPVLLRTLADALRAIGARDAMCLDGGDSTGLYYAGKTRVKPGRLLTNLLVVYQSTERYRQFAGALTGRGIQVAESEPAGRG